MNRTRSSCYGADVNFLASSQAREDEIGFMRVKRAQWIGALVGEEPMPGLVATSQKKKGSAEEEKSVFWNELALYEQKRIIAGLGEHGGEPPSTAGAWAEEPSATGEISGDDKGVIVIPAAACSSPIESTKTLFKGAIKDLVVFLKNNSGDALLHLSRYSTPDDSFEYTFNVPDGGKYQLAARVVTANPNQRLFASVNEGGSVEVALPYTVGMWGKTEPLGIKLKEGKNVLKFHGPARVTIDHFTLTPLK